MKDQLSAERIILIRQDLEKATAAVESIVNIMDGRVPAKVLDRALKMRRTVKLFAVNVLDDLREHA